MKLGSFWRLVPEAIMVQVQPEDAETCPGVKEASEPVPLLLRRCAYHLDRYGHVSCGISSFFVPSKQRPAAADGRAH